MGVTDVAYCSEALEANRSGQLSGSQRRELEAQLSRSAGGLLGTVLRRTTRLAHDVRAGGVESVDGAVTKRMGTDIDYIVAGTESTAPTSYRVWVANRGLGNQEFRCDADVYDFTPDAGMIRLHYLPRSRWIINVERLPDAPVGDISSPDGLAGAFESGLAGLRAGDKVSLAEARARFAAVEHEIETYVPTHAPTPGQPVEPDVLAAAIVGTWTSPFMVVSFERDGTLTAEIPNNEAQHGRWHVDEDGRLCADILGAAQVADAWIADDLLTLQVAGRPLALRRSQPG